MCLAIPGQIVRLIPDSDLATADVSGVKRNINVGLVSPEGIAPGDWVLIHVGFALSKVDEQEARASLEFLQSMGQAFRDESRRFPGTREAAEMRFVDEFRDRNIAGQLGVQIARLAAAGRAYRFMEVCGGHTHTIYKHGIEDYLPPNITLVHGPGCPVCVIPMGHLDDAIFIARQPGVIMTCFGDMMCVPGGKGSFLDASAEGTDIRMVYSPLDALKIAQHNPQQHVVFFAIGFETTAPSTALTLLKAAAEGVENFSVSVIT